MNAVNPASFSSLSSLIDRNDFFSYDLINKARSFGNKKLSRTKICRTFKYIDSDGSGVINRTEFRKVMWLLQFNFSNSVISDIFNHLDRNCKGTIELHEFEHFLNAPLRPANRIRCDFSINLGDSSLFRKFHIWYVKNRPLSFTLSSGENNISAYFEQSSSPAMARCLKKGARLFYINSAPVENANYKDIESTLSSIECPFILVFQNLDTRHIRRPEVLNLFKDMNFEGWPNILSPVEKELCHEPLENHTAFESTTEDSNKREHNFNKHCKHCPDDDVWYLHVHLMMENEKYSAASNVLAYVIMLLITLSTFIYIFQTLPIWEDWMVWQSMEGAISIAFTVEFLFRILSCRSVKIYMKDFMNVVDFCAVIPYWLELVSSGLIQPELLRVVRVIRLLRLIRLAKSRNLQDILTIYRLTCEDSIQWLAMFLFLGFVSSIVVASFFYICEVGDERVFGRCSVLSYNEFCEDNTVDVLYSNLSRWLTSGAECESACAEFQERGCCSFDQISGKCQFFNSSVYSNGSSSGSPYYSGFCDTKELHIRQDGMESPFFNIPIGIWVSYVTMTMVGYGEISPVSYEGRFVAVFASICGPIFFALGIIVVGSHFTLSIYTNKMSKLSTEASKKATVINILKMVNEAVGTEFFKPKDQLPFLGSDSNLTSKQKIENLLLSDHGWDYLPFAREDKVGFTRLSQYKLFVLFGIFGRKLKKIMDGKKKQIRVLESALDLLNQRTTFPFKPQVVKLTDSLKVGNNKNNVVSQSKTPSSVSFIHLGSGSTPIVSSVTHTTVASRGGSVSMGCDAQSYSSPRKLLEYVSGEMKGNDSDNSMTRTDYESHSASLAITSVDSNHPNRQEIATELYSEGKVERKNEGVNL